MDFDLTDEQVMLRDTVRELLARTYDSETRLKVTETELGWSRDVWRQLAELGVLGLSFAEEDGGMGAGPVETMLVLEEVGRRLAPEPILDAVLVPGGLVAAAGTPISGSGSCRNWPRATSCSPSPTPSRVSAGPRPRSPPARCRRATAMCWRV